MAPFATSWFRPDTGDTRYCDPQFRAKAGPISRASGHPVMGLFKAAIDEERALDKEQADREAANSFLALPDVVLAPLAQCTAHSLLAPVCAMWATRHLENDKPTQAKIYAAFLENAKVGDDQACIVLDAANRILPAEARR